jgi:hypothetical protein
MYDCWYPLFLLRGAKLSMPTNIHLNENELPFLLSCPLTDRTLGYPWEFRNRCPPLKLVDAVLDDLSHSRTSSIHPRFRSGSHRYPVPQCVAMRSLDFLVSWLGRRQPRFLRCDRVREMIERWDWSRDYRTRCDLFSNLWKIRFVLIHFVLRVCSFVDVCHEIFSDILNVRSILETALVEPHRFLDASIVLILRFSSMRYLYLSSFRFFVREFFLRIFERFVVFRDLHWRIRCRSISRPSSHPDMSLHRDEIYPRISYFPWIARFDPAGSTNSSNPISPSQKIPSLFHAWLITFISQSRRSCTYCSHSLT